MRHTLGAGLTGLSLLPAPASLVASGLPASSGSLIFRHTRGVVPASLVPASAASASLASASPAPASRGGGATFKHGCGASVLLPLGGRATFKHGCGFSQPLVTMPAMVDAMTKRRRRRMMASRALSSEPLVTDVAHQINVELFVVEVVEKARLVAEQLADQVEMVRR